MKRAFAITSCILISILMAPPQVEGDYPELTDYITDEEGFITYNEFYDDLYWVCEVLEEETSAVIAVLVVNSTNGEDIAMYSTEVFNLNGLGEKDKDNGLLIVLAVGDGTYFVAVGRGLEGILNDAKVGRYARENLVPYLETGDYAEGLYYLALFLGSDIEKYYEQQHEKKDYPIAWIPLPWPQLIVVIIIIGSILVLTNGRIMVIWLPSKRDMGKGRSGGGGAGGKFGK